MDELKMGKISCDDPIKIPEISLEVSARHVHLSQEAVDKLFGRGYRLKPKKYLSQPGEFLAEERVSIIGPKGIIENCAVLGPVRPKNQVEVSVSDIRKLGVKAQVKDSGDLIGTPGIILASSEGIVKFDEGVIIARRHIHMTPTDAAYWDLKDKEIVKVKVCSSRPLVFDDVLVRVSDKFSLAMHIDTDEAGACFADKSTKVNVLKDHIGTSSTSEKHFSCVTKKLEPIHFSKLDQRYQPQTESGTSRDKSRLVSKELKITDKLLTEYKLKEIAKSGVNKLIVSKKTIITSLALDLLKEEKIEVSRI
jgi:putative phosphotransacetylase